MSFESVSRIQFSKDAMLMPPTRIINVVKRDLRS